MPELGEARRTADGWTEFYDGERWIRPVSGNLDVRITNPVNIIPSPTDSQLRTMLDEAVRSVMDDGPPRARARVTQPPQIPVFDPQITSSSRRESAPTDQDIRTVLALYTEQDHMDDVLSAAGNELLSALDSNLYANESALSRLATTHDGDPIVSIDIIRGTSARLYTARVVTYIGPGMFATRVVTLSEEEVIDPRTRRFSWRLLDASLVRRLRLILSPFLRTSTPVKQEIADAVCPIRRRNRKIHLEE